MNAVDLVTTLGERKLQSYKYAGLLTSFINNLADEVVVTESMTGTDVAVLFGKFTPEQLVQLYQSEFPRYTEKLEQPQSGASSTKKSDVPESGSPDNAAGKAKPIVSTKSIFTMIKTTVVLSLVVIFGLAIAATIVTTKQLPSGEFLESFFKMILDVFSSIG